MLQRRPQLRIVAPSASPEEAAAVVAALEQFMRDTAPTPAPPTAEKSPPREPAPRSAWARAALLEGAGYANGEPVAWGRDAG